MSKILLISHIFPPAIDGGSRVIFKLGQYLESQNHQTLYLSSDCSSTDDFTKKFHSSKDLKNYSSNVLKIPVYHHLRRPLKFLNLFLPKNSYLYGLIKVFQKGPIFKIIPFIKTTITVIKFKPDLIIAGPLPTTIILYANFFKKISTIYNLRPKILFNASFHPTDPDFLQKPLIKTLQSADYIWTLTQSETNFFIKNFNIDPSKLILAGNGIDPNFLRSKALKFQRSKALNILFIGSLSAHKGLTTLIAAFSYIQNSKDLKFKGSKDLIIAGQKTLFYPQIKKQISKLPKDIRSSIKFIFNFPNKKLAQLIDQSDILVLPSQQESFGLVLIESWARSKPVITSNIPALKELVIKTHGGLTFKTNQPKLLAQKISKLINSPILRQQLGQNGFNYVKNNYTWPIVGQKICQKISLSE